jgi:hypothetical protein
MDQNNSSTASSQGENTLTVQSKNESIGQDKNKPPVDEVKGTNVSVMVEGNGGIYKGDLKVTANEKPQSGFLRSRINFFSRKGTKGAKGGKNRKTKKTKKSNTRKNSRKGSRKV